jgi:hypothetical protein
MAAPCTFDNVTVPSRHVVRELILGSMVYEVDIDCATKTYSGYTALAAKAGHIQKRRLLSGYTRVTGKNATKGTLVLNGVTHTNCYIESISVAEADGMQLGLWEFRISFVRHTAS